MQSKMSAGGSPCNCKLSFFQVQDRVERLHHLLVIHQLWASFGRFLQVKTWIFVVKNNVACNFFKRLVLKSFLVRQPSPLPFRPSVYKSLTPGFFILQVLTELLLDSDIWLVIEAGGDVEVWFPVADAEEGR